MNIKRRSEDTESDVRTDKSIFRLFRDNYGYKGPNDYRELAKHQLRHNLYFSEETVGRGYDHSVRFGSTLKSAKCHEEFSKENDIYDDLKQ